MAAYLEKAKEQLSLFSAASIEVIPLSKNSNVDALPKLASTKDADLLNAVFIEYLAEPSIHPQPGITELTREPSWMNPIVAYLKTGEQPKDKKVFSSVTQPLVNGQVKVVNKVIKHNLKTKFENLKGRWAYNLPKMLWAYRTTARSTTGETLFLLAYGYKVMVPVELEVGFLKRDNYDPE